MPSEIDFLDLYRQLRLTPDCDLQAFKQAYRRRVATLHPDRPPQGRVDSRAGQRLQQLNVQYSAAMEFQRVHGRLPGATPPARVPAADMVAPPARRPRPVPARASRTSRWKIAMPLAVLVAGLLFWGMFAAPPPTTDAATDASSDTPSSAAQPAAAPQLILGMSPASVRDVEGEPVMVRDELWEYGPSWIRFEHGVVSDWYSSPMHSLKTTGQHPPGARN